MIKNHYYNEKDINLKPCPFCGEKHIECFTIENGWKIKCSFCFASVFEFSKFKDGVILKWNKRKK